MKTATLAIFLSVISIGAVGALYMKVDDLADHISMQRVRSTATARAPADEIIRPVVPQLRESSTPESHAAPRDDSMPASSTKSTTDKQRIESLEKQVQDLQKKRTPSMPFFKNRKFYRNVNDLARDLKLSPNQKDRMADIVDRGKALIDEIMKIPDEEGKSPAQRRKAAQQKLHERFKNGGVGGGNIMPLIQKMTGHRNKTIPGRNVTYGQEIDRVQEETRYEMEGVLDNDQKEQFKDANTGALLGGASGPAGGISVFHSVSSTSSDGEHREGETTTGVIVGGMTPVEIEIVEETEEPSDD